MKKLTEKVAPKAMIGTPISKTTTLVLGVLSVSLMAAFYAWLSYQQHLENPKDATIPNLVQLLDGLKKMTTPDRSRDIWIWVDSMATLSRLGIGMTVSVVLGVLIGVFMGTVSVVEAILYPPLSFLAKIVPTAAMAVFFVLVGTDTKMFVAMIVFGVLPSLAISVYLAVKEVPQELIHKSYTLGASHMEAIWLVVFPYILPKVIDAIRLQIGPAMVYLIAAEMIVSDVGFGYRIRLLSRRLDMQVVYPYLIFLAAFGYGADFSLRKLRSWLCPWSEE